MSAEKATALVLRVIDFSETSAVVTLFTRELGKVRGLAKGARRPKGPFESALDLLALCRIVFLRKSSDALDLLTEAKLLRRFRPGGELARLYAGYYVAELLGDMTDDYDPHPELFDAADQTLLELGGHETPVAALILRFELTALRVLGHLPALGECAECGGAIAASRRVAFGQLTGGVLCQRCRAGKRGVVSISNEVLHVLQQFAQPEGDQWRQTELAPNVLGELRGVVNHYFYHLLGHKLRLHDFLGKHCR